MVLLYDSLLHYAILVLYYTYRNCRGPDGVVLADPLVSGWRGGFIKFLDSETLRR